MARLPHALPLAAVFSICAGSDVRAGPPAPVPEPPGQAVTFAALPGFADDDIAAAFRAFRASCKASAGRIRAATPPPAALKRVCAAARPLKRRAAIRAFFERQFTPRQVATEAFFTGYYEPVVAGSLVATPAFPTPLYARPADLVSVAPGATQGLDPTLTMARKLPDGRLVAPPDRAAIETGALGAAGHPLVYVESPLEAFFIHVQGSARIRLPDGTLRRLVFASRNGYPYTSIGKILVTRLNIPPSQMGMAQLKAWIRDHGQSEGDVGTRLMRENRSFIFFKFDESLPVAAGPIGGEGLSLTPLRSLAIDRSLWPYGLPFYVDTRLPDATPFRRLLISQDTGSAIIGRARADIFFGTGPEAARQAGAVRQPGSLFVLWPNTPSRPPSRPKAKRR